MFIDIDKAKDSLKDNASALSPFVFREISLAHLEIDSNITLKFRKANFLDHEFFRQKYGEKLIDLATQDLLNVVDVIFHFLSKESKKVLLDIKFTVMDDEGVETAVSFPLKEIFRKILVSSINGHQELFNLFLEIFGYSKEQLEAMQKAGKEKAKKKTD